MNKVELLAPAGNLEKAKIALIYGADAILVAKSSVFEQEHLILNLMI